MTREEKQLLLIDLCARLPYGVKVWYKYSPDKYLTGLEIPSMKVLVGHKFDKVERTESIVEAGEILIKPYLRPMSSMNEEEGKEFNIITNGEKGFYEDEDGWVRCDNIHTKWGVWPKGCAEMIDWLNEHHFDYRGLIEKGFAIEAPEGMYKF